MAGIKIRQEHYALQNFINNPGEKIIIFQRVHWVVPILSSIETSLMGLVVLIGPWVALSRLLVSFSIFLALELLFTTTILLIIAKIIVDWQFHFYLVTSEKILEIRYSPFFSHNTNGILLKQVNITEIDDRKMGVLKDILDYGDVAITFDRPTHQDEFILENVPYPGKIANILREHFSVAPTSSTRQIWYMPRHRNNGISFKPI